MSKAFRSPLSPAVGWAMALVLCGLSAGACASGFGPSPSTSAMSAAPASDLAADQASALAAIAHLRVPVEPEAEGLAENSIQSVYCARTMNELRQLAQNLALVAGAKQIHLASGTFLFGQNEKLTFDGRGLLFGVGPGEIHLIGGYNNDCSSRTSDARLTVLRNEAGATGGSIDLWASRHSIIVRNLTLNVHANMGREGRGGYARDPRQGQRIILDRVRSQAGGWWLDVGTHNVLIDNFLKTGGRIDIWLNEYGAFQPFIVQMINTTLANEGIFLGCFDRDFRECTRTLGGVNVYNSVLQNSDIYFHGSVVNLYYNVNIGNPVGLGSVLGVSEGNVPGPALLDANFVPRFNSPAVDSGTAAVPGNLALYDNYGRDRIRGVAVDRGALESSFDSSTPSLHMVTNTNASGAGSLRQAIINAGINGGANRIQFAIPGSGCPKRIIVNEPLPQISVDVSIEGYTQVGSVPNSSGSGWNAVPCVLVSGNNSVNLGLQAINGSRLRVSGLGFEGFTSGAISIIGGVDHVIVGNQFGGSIGTRVLQANGVNVSVAFQGRRARIGGPEPAQRNLLSRATGSAISLNANTSENSVVNNLIGTTASLLGTDPNGTGILINLSSNNEILNNRIYGNTLDGVRIQGETATGNVIADNRFYTPLLLGGAIANDRHAVWIRNDARDNRIGPNNLMSRHSESPIRISGGRRNEVTANRIFNNSKIGIDIGLAGVNPILGGSGSGCGSGEANANCRLNAPQITNVSVERVNLVFRRLVIDFMMLAPNGNYRIEIFQNNTCQGNDPAGHGPGHEPLVTTQVNVINGLDPNSIWQPRTFRASVPLLLGALPPEGSAITAVATRSDGNSSEFSRCYTLRSDEIFADRFR